MSFWPIWSGNRSALTDEVFVRDFVGTFARRFRIVGTARTGDAGGEEKPSGNPPPVPTAPGLGKRPPPPRVTIFFLEVEPIHHEHPGNPRRLTARRQSFAGPAAPDAARAGSTAAD